MESLTDPTLRESGTGMYVLETTEIDVAFDKVTIGYNEGNDAEIQLLVDSKIVVKVAESALPESVVDELYDIASPSGFTTRNVPGA